MPRPPASGGPPGSCRSRGRRCATARWRARRAGSPRWGRPPRWPRGFPGASGHRPRRRHPRAGVRQRALPPRVEPDGRRPAAGRLRPLAAADAGAAGADGARGPPRRRPPRGAARAAAGTTTLADSGPTGAGAAAMAEAGLRGAVHLEAFGSPEGDAARRAAAAVAERVAALDADAGPGVRVGVSPHAPYTVGPALWRALADEPGLSERPWATHLAESEAEARVVARGEGPLAEVFAEAGFAPGPLGGARAASRPSAGSRAAGGCARAWWPRTACAWRRRPGDAARRGRERRPLPALERAPARRPGAARRAPAGRGARGAGHRQPGQRRRLRRARRGARLRRRPRRRSRGADWAALLRLATLGGAEALGLGGRGRQPRARAAGRPGRAAALRHRSATPTARPSTRRRASTSWSAAASRS